MARLVWTAARTLAEGAAFDHYKESLVVKSGAVTVTLSGVLDTSQDRETSQSPDGTFIVRARLSCWRGDLGFLPNVNEVIRVARATHPIEEQAFLVLSVDTTSDLLEVELKAHTNNAHPFY